MKKKVVRVALISAVLVVGSLAGLAPPASADTPRCATFQEFRQVIAGTRKARVHRIFDISGQFADGSAGGYTRYYGSCRAVRDGGGDSGAFITYNGRTNRVVEKRWIG